MTPLPFLPAAPAPKTSGPDFQNASLEAVPSTPGEKGSSEPTFEEVLTRSSVEDKPHDPSEESNEPLDEGVAILGMAVLLPPAALQLSPSMDLTNAGTSLQNVTQETVLAEVNAAQPETSGDWLQNGNPTLEQPIPISKPWVQAVYPSPSELSPQPLPILNSQPVFSTQPTPSVPGEPASAALPEFAALPRPLGDSQLPVPSNPANPAVLVQEFASETRAEQITVAEAGLNSEREEKNAATSDAKGVQAAWTAAGGISGTGKRPISGVRTGAGTDGAGGGGVMSAALLQSNQTPASPKTKGEPFGVFGAADQEDAALGKVAEFLGTMELGTMEFSDPSGVVYKTPEVGAVTQPHGAQASAPANPAHGAPAHIDAARVLEHLEATFAKYRPNVPPHLELSVDLQGGDTLQVRLDLRGDALQSTFRTDSPELRLALQRAWPEFAERSQQQGLNLSPASFDSPGMSADSGPGSQADGRRQGAQDSDGPLPEAFRKAPAQFARKTGEPAQGPRESVRTRWA